MVSITDFLGNIVPPFFFIEGWIRRTIYFPRYNYIFFVFQIFILEYRSRMKVCNVFIIIRCIDINQHIQFVLDLSGSSNFDNIVQSNPFLKSMATPHKFGLQCDIIIAPPHSYFHCLSESFFEGVSCRND